MSRINFNGREYAVFDLDGTCFDITHRVPLAKAQQWEAFYAALQDDTPREAERLMATAWSMSGGNIIYCTGRDAKYYDATVKQLMLHRFPHGDVLMRKDGDRRPDLIVKYELLSQFIAFDKIAFVVEDRARVVEMWRGCGLTVMHCQPGAY